MTNAGSSEIGPGSDAFAPDTTRATFRKLLRVHLRFALGFMVSASWYFGGGFTFFFYIFVAYALASTTASLAGTDEGTASAAALRWRMIAIASSPAWSMLLSLAWYTYASSVLQATEDAAKKQLSEDGVCAVIARDDTGGPWPATAAQPTIWSSSFRFFPTDGWEDTRFWAPPASFNGSVCGHLSFDHTWGHRCEWISGEIHCY